MDRDIKIGIIGAGNIGKTHGKAIRAINGNITCILDSNLKRARDLKELLDGDFFTDDLDEFFSHDLDVVHLCLPSNLHFPYLKELIERDINFICEKPMVLDFREALILRDLLEGKNILSAIGFNIRYHSGIGRLKEELKKDGDRKINFLYGSYLQEFHLLPLEYSWRYDEKMAGKMRAVSEIGSHFFDLVEYICEREIVSVSASFSYFHRERFLDSNIMYDENHSLGEKFLVNSEDGAVITFRLEDGTLGNVVLSESSPGRVNFLELEILCDDMTLNWNSEDINSINLGKRNEGFKRLTNPFEGGFGDSYVRFFNDFYGDLKNMKRSDSSKYASFEDGLRNVLIGEAIYLSNENESKWINIGDIKNG